MREVKLTSQNHDANVLVFELGHEFSCEHRDDLRTRASRVVVIEHEQRLHVDAENAILQLDALDGREQVDFALFEPSQHDGGNGDVGRLLDTTRRVIVGTSAVQNDDFLLGIAAAALATSQLTDEGVLVDEFDLGVRHVSSL